MYAPFLVLSVLIVVCGWTVGVSLLLLSVKAPWIPQRWALGRVSSARGRVFVAGLAVILLTTVAFMAMDLVVPDFPGPRTSGVWATIKTPSASNLQNRRGFGTFHG
jgi:hypothetical protein